MILQVEDLNVAHRSRPILNMVSFSVPPKTLTAVMGPSGSGKTTLLRTLNRLIEEEVGYEIKGRVVFQGKSIFGSDVDKTELRQRIGMVFQRPVVFPVSIYKNVLFGVQRIKNVPRRLWPDLAEKLLNNVGLWNEVKDRLHSPARELSLGQQQRLTIARTLALDPMLILMDEPTASLDPAATERIENLIRELKNQHTILLVTHKPSQAEALAEQQIMLT